MKIGSRSNPKGLYIPALLTDGFAYAYPSAIDEETAFAVFPSRLFSSIEKGTKNITKTDRKHLGFDNSFYLCGQITKPQTAYVA